MIRTLAAALTTTTCLVALASPATAQTREFNIPAGSLRTALDTFARQSGRQVIYRGDEVRSARSPGVHGAQTAEEALDTILAGTGFKARRDSSGAYAVVKVGNDQTPGESSSKPPEDSGQESAEIVVTGTNIRGSSNPTIPLSSFGRTEIQRSGFGTTQDFIRSLPQNFNGGATGASEDGVINSTNGLGNVENASGINLRGLGNSSTLVLLNGHRVAPSAYGNAVDISLFPLAAIERIDLLPDGASAVYGADAVAGVANFVLRSDYNGAETYARASVTSRGDRPENQIGQTFGRAWSTGNVLISGQYRTAGSLSTTERSFTSSALQPTDLYPSVKQFSIVGTGNQTVGIVKLHGDILYSHTSSSRAFSSIFGTDITNTKSTALSASGGATVEVGAWELSADGLYSKVKSDLRQPQSSTPDYTLGTLFLANNFTMTEGSFKAEGPLARLPAGEVRLAAGGSYRHDDFKSLLAYKPLDRSFARDVKSAFAEVLLPVTGSEAPALLRDIVVSGALRYDDYSDFPNTTNYRLGLSARPASGLSVRVSYGTSYRAPTAGEINDLATNLNVFAYPGFASPGGGTENVFLYSSKKLDPEKARTLSAGFEYKPEWLNKLTLSGNFFTYDYRNRIISAPFDPAALLAPNVYGNLVHPIANDTAAADFLSELLSEGYQYNDFTGTGSSGIRNAILIGTTNAARVRLTGFDASASYSFTAGKTTYNVALSGTYIGRIKTSLCNACSAEDLVNTYGQPLRFRARAQAGVSRGGVQLTTFFNYANRYRATNVVPEQRINDDFTVDLTSNIDLPKGFQLGLSIFNLFDRDPPHTPDGLTPGIQYDAGNASPLGRVFAVSARKRW